MRLSPRRRFLGLAAWCWLAFPPAFVYIVYLMGRPADLPEPPEGAVIFEPIILVTREGQSFRFVPSEQQEDVMPLWAVSRTTRYLSTTDWSIGLKSGSFHPGFYRRNSRWTYELFSHSFGKNWNTDKSHPRELTQSELEQLRPQVIELLNQRSPNERLGDRLEQLLETGIEKTSYLCVQNALILAAWLSFLPALAALVAMFVNPKQVLDKLKGNLGHEKASRGERP
jgi:hypothetical protein